MRSWRFRQGRLSIVIMSIIIFILLNALIFVLVENSKVCLRLPCKEKECEVCPDCPEVEKLECPEVEEKECPEVEKLECPTIEEKTYKELVCNPPYIRNDYGCCLDNNDNKICDEQDIIYNSTIKETKKSKLQDAAEYYAKNFINKSYENIYSILPDDAKNMMSESKFEDLFSAVVYGVRCGIIGNSEDYSCHIEEQPYKTMYVDNVEIKNSVGNISYSVRNQYDLINYSGESFVYENETWKISSLNYLPYAGCEDVNDCSDKDDFLNPLCTDSCKNYRNMQFSIEKPFECRENVCYCGCWSEINQFWTYIRPSNDYINEFSLNK